ncbi:hypothetical protein C0J52_13043 [Blattella germanica]|nr:hypothetical protein C0J52_13043 [Blattella germanica]
MDVRSYRGANVDTDHYLVLAKIHSKISTLYYEKKISVNKKYEISKIQDPDIERQFKTTLENKLHNIDYEEEANEKHWTILKQAIHTTADEILGGKAKTIRSGWYDKECEEATKRKNLAYKEIIQKHHTRNSEERYREERREEKKIHRRKKKIYFEEQLQRIEELNAQKESRKFYKLINNMRKDFKPRISTSRKKNGEITNDTNEILDTWKEHLKELLDGEDQVDTVVENVEETIDENTQSNKDDKEDSELPTIEEVKDSIKKLNQNRAPGPDNINNEIIKFDTTDIFANLHKIINRVWRTEKLTSELEEGLICPIFKKGDPLECKNYHGITLLNSAYK